MGKDRTKEFFSLVQKYQPSSSSSSSSSSSVNTDYYGNSSNNGNSVSPLSAVADAALEGKYQSSSSRTSLSLSSSSFASSYTPSSFTKAAAEVSRDLQLTSRKIADLTQLVKRRSMWDDNTPSSSSLSSSSGLLPATTVTSTSQAIDTLTISIKQDVTRLNSTLDHLQEYIDQRKTESQSNGTKSLVSSSTSSSYAQGKTNSGVVVPDLLSSSQGISHGDIVISSLKNQLLSFSLSLRDALTVRGDGIKHIADRRQVFGRMANRDLGRPLTFPSSSSPHDNKQGNDSTAITIVMNDGKNNSSSVVYGGGSSSSNQHNRQAYDAASLSNAATAPLLPSNSSAASSFALMTQAQLEPEAAYLASRAQDVRQVEAAVSEISTLFGRLAHLVSEQNSQIERIDQDIESADQRIHDAQTQLQKYYERVSSNKLLILKVLSILVFFIILFSIFVA